ncbi:hypothetical protein BD413DRAFT_464582 [Trametes elegans]|nr:hypothetical protein BD413DRAFT_464582 [Trametes elegans]
MSLLFTPVVVTPLLKIPLLLSNAVCTYYGMKPPTPIAQPQERAKFAKSDFLGGLWTPNVMVNLAIGLRATLCGLALAEVVALLANQAHPSSGDLSHFISGGLSITPVFLAGSAFTVFGGSVRILCHRTLGRFFTWQMSVQDDHKLVTSGPYSIVRHPSYSGWVVLVIGQALALLSPGSFYAESGALHTVAGKTAAGAVVGYLGFITYVLCSRIRKEDEVLQREFGEEWNAWAKKTPYRLIPYIY